jgi:hypothetical protein
MLASSRPQEVPAMANPPETDKDRETEEIDREMAILDKVGGGATEAAPLRRLAYLAIALIAIFVVARLFFWD